METLAEFRQHVRSRLSVSRSNSDYVDGAVDDALRLALRESLDDGLVLEKLFTIVADGRTQDLSGDEELHRIMAVAWPWYEEDPLWLRQVSFREISPLVLRLEINFTRRGIGSDQGVGDYGARYSISGEPVIGEQIRLRYLKKYTIVDLDGASETSLLARHGDAVVNLAAGYLAHVRMGDVEDVATRAVLRERGDMLRADYRRLMDAEISGTSEDPSWFGIGL